jgi:hypothetical protein
MNESRRRTSTAGIVAGLAVLMVLASYCSNSESRTGDPKPAVSAVAAKPATAEKPCADCPPAGSQSAGGRRHLAGDARAKARRTPEEVAQTGEKLGGVLAKLAEASGEAPSETYDPQAIVDKVGSEVEPLFTWVRDNTWLVPYQGSLRGPAGVLMDRLGNSLDRALLLCDLLGRAGLDARLAHAALSEKQAREILDKAAAPPAPPAPRAAPPLTDADREAIKGYASEFGVDERALFKAVEDETARRTALAGRASRGEADILPGLLDLAAKHRTQNADAETRQAVEDLRDHWWVRVETDSGTADLDPSLPDAVPGKALTAAEGTTAPDGLDEGMIHRIVLRVVMERWEAGRSAEQEVLRREFRPSETAGRRMILSHAPADWPDMPDTLRRKDAPKRLHDAILKQKGWTPVLKVGDDEEKGSGFDAAGQLLAKGAKKKGGGGPLGGLGGGLMGGAAGGSETPAADEKSVLTAEWVEYEILSPGRPARTVRRELFDLVGPAGRAGSSVPRPQVDDAARMTRSLALLGRTEILPLYCRWSEDYARYLADGHLLAEQEALLSFYDVDTLKKPEEVLEKLSQLDRLPAALYQIARAGRVPGGYLASPNILSLHSIFWEDAKGVLQRGAAIDIVDNSGAVRPALAEEAFRTRLAQGVRDSVRESVLSAQAQGDDPLTRFYREAAKAGVGWLAAAPGDAGVLAKVELPPDLVARLREAMRDGDVVVFPKRAVVLDGRPVVRWWKFDPASGDALVLDERGWGQPMTSYVQKVERIMQLKGWVELGADILKCALTGVVAAFGNDPKMDTNAFLTCIQVILCNQLYNQFEDYCDLETNWTNFILKQIAGYLAGEFCDLVSDDETWKGASS